MALNKVKDVALDSEKIGILSKKVYINVMEYGATGDGITDDTQAIINAFAFAQSIESTPKVIVFPTATYMINGTTADGNENNYGRLRIPSNTTIELSGSTLKIIPNNNQHSSIFRAQNKSNIVVRNGYLYGDLVMPNTKSGEWQFGVDIESCKNVRIERVNCYNMRGDGLYFGYTDVTIKNQNVEIDQCLVDTVWRNGISVTSGYNIVVRNCTINNTTGGSLGAGIDFEPDADVDANYIEKAIVENCTFNNIVGAAIRFQYSKNCRAINNLVNTAMEGIEIRQAYNIEIYKNILNSIQGILINSYPSGDITFKRNIIRFTGATLSGFNSAYFNIWGTSTNVRVSDNEFLSAGNANVTLIYTSATLVHIFKNNFMNCESGTSGFEYLRTKQNTVTYFYDNEITMTDNHSVSADIRARDNSSCIIKNNTVINGNLILDHNESGIYSTDALNGIPTLGTYNVGHDVRNTAPTATGYRGWICVTAGTAGTLSGVTGSITSGTPTLTVNVIGTLLVGQYISIAGVTGIFRILSISGTTVTLSANAGATVSGAAVSYSNPVFKGYGVIQT